MQCANCGQRRPLARWGGWGGQVGQTVGLDCAHPFGLAFNGNIDGRIGVVHGLLLLHMPQERSSLSVQATAAISERLPMRPVRRAV